MGKLTPEQVLAWATAVRVLVTVGGVTWNAIRQIFRVAGLSDEQQNQILDDVITDAVIRRAISAAESQ